MFDRGMKDDSLEIETPSRPPNPWDRSLATKTSTLPSIPPAVSGSRTTKSRPYGPAKLPKQWHKARLELPLQYNKNRGLVWQPRPRLDMEMSFPVWSSSSSSSSNCHANQILECELSAISALRGKTGYCNGSAGLRWTNIDTTSTTRRTTALTASVSNQQADVLDPPLDPNAATVQLGVETMASSKAGTTLSTYFYFPKPLSEPAQCKVFLAAYRRFHLPRMQQPVKFGTHFSTSSINNPMALGFVASDAPVAPSSSPSSSSSSSGNKRKRWELKLGFTKLTNETKNRSSSSSYIFLPSIQLFVSPPQKLAPRTLTDMGVFWKATHGWGLGGTWRYNRNEKSTTSNRELSVGALLNVSRKMKSLSWVFSWTESDCTLRIPVVISQTASTLIETYQQQLLQFIYISLLSRMIQGAMVTFLSPTNKDSENQTRDKPEFFIVRHQKARKDALQQQIFMARQAKIRTKAEEERNGLIIKRAVYYIRSEREFLNDQNSLDVTIPIQFWVDDSKLHLFDVGKRGSMLGFYDLIQFASSVATVSQNSETTPKETPPTRAEALFAWTDRIFSFFSHASDRLSVQDSATPVEPSLTAELAVTYSFAGTIYEIIIGDGSEIILPDPGASRVAANGV